MEGQTNICQNCFEEFFSAENGSICPKCGWNNSKTQPQGSLELGTLIASRYRIGRVKAVDGEGITYAAFDEQLKKAVEIREFFPLSISDRMEDGSVSACEGKSKAFEELLSEFMELSKNIARMKDFSVMPTVTDTFEEKNTAYAVYACVPSVSFKRYIEAGEAPLDWNEAYSLFLPAISALAYANSLGVMHLGISPETLRVTEAGKLMISGFSVHGLRTAGTEIIEELYPGCAALEQYDENGSCTESSDVYAVAATLFYAVTGELPREAAKRKENPRLMMSRSISQQLPPYVITALANALQVTSEARTASLEAFRAEITSSPTVITEIEKTGAIRRLPSMKQKIPQNRGLPAAVWLLGSFVLTIAVIVVAVGIWLNNNGQSFSDLTNMIFQEDTGEQIVVPNLINQSYAECEEKIAGGQYQFKLTVGSREFSDTVEEGNIISQVPFSAEKINSGDTVTVTVSRGSEMRTLPEIKGMSFAEIQDVLTANGFTPVKEDAPSDDVEVGYVISYKDHSEGESLEYGQVITVIVSSGPATE